MTDLIEKYYKAAGIIAMTEYKILMCLNHFGTYELPGGRRDLTKKFDMHSAMTALREFTEEVPMHFEMPALRLILANPRYIQLTPDRKWAYLQYFLRIDSLDEKFVERLNQSRIANNDTRPCYNEIKSYKLIDFRKLDSVPIRDRDVTILANVRPYLRIISYFTRSVESVNGYFGIVVTIPKLPKTDTSHQKRQVQKKVQAILLRKRVSGQ